MLDHHEKKKKSDHKGVQGPFEIDISSISMGGLRKVPVIAWESVKDVRGGNAIERPAEQYVYTDIKGKTLFALKLCDEGLAPEFPEGVIVIVNADLPVPHGEYGVVIYQDSQVFVRQLLYQDDYVILKSLSPAWPDLILSKDQINIVGRVMGKRKIY
ncbi:MAG: S24 family peptidase [Candidatus Tectomicrobia bacterium]|nr:S24 family peptidase [Candidatus Tectomicrobia bacterium]